MHLLWQSWAGKSSTSSIITFGGLTIFDVGFGFDGFGFSESTFSVLIIFLIGSESATFIIIVDTKMNKEHTEIINNEIFMMTSNNKS